VDATALVVDAMAGQVRLRLPLVERTSRRLRLVHQMSPRPLRVGRPTATNRSTGRRVVV